MTTTPNFQIGQIIFILSNKDQTVLPGIVQEEIVSRRLDGDSVNYKISIGPVGKNRIVDLEKVDGEVYGSLDDIRQILTQRITSFVDQLCETTNERVRKWYGEKASVGVTPESPGDKIDPSLFIDQVAGQQNSLQPYQQQQQQMSSYQPPLHQARQQLKERLTAPLEGERGPGGPTVQLTDGSIHKISIGNQ